MIYLGITLHARMASFRDPETQTYHRTLPLPPPATCIGLAGAALGMSGSAVQDFFAPGEWQLGVAGNSNGFVKDLWKYDDFKDGSIILREYLYDNHFYLLFGHTDRAKLDRLASAFRQPHFALTCGNSDSLCRVSDLQLLDKAPSKPERLLHCYAPGKDWARFALQQLQPGEPIRMETTAMPISQELVVRYNFLKDGVRIVSERRNLSYVHQLPVPANTEIHGRHYQGRFVPLFDL